MPKDQPDQEAGEFSVQKLDQASTFKGVAEAFLGVTGDIEFLAKTLKDRGHVTTLPVVEYLVERQESGENVSLLTNGWGNFFFVDEDEDKKSSGVSVVYVYRDDRQWYVRVCGLGVGPVWRADSRFFFRN